MVISFARLALIACLVWAGSAQAAGRTFFDDWESGGTGSWSQDGSRNRCNVVTSAADGGVGPQTGSYMLRCNWNGVVAWDDPAAFETLRLSSFGFSGGSEIFFRFYIRVDNNAKDHPANGPKIFRLVGSSFWALNFRTGTANGSLYNGADNQIDGTFWGGSNTLSNGQWHKLEMYIKNGTTDGVVRYWEDDVMQYEATSVNTSQSGGVSNWAPFYISSNWSGAEGCCDHDTSNYLYWDNFEIYSDTASGATGSMSAGTITQGGGDTTPPVRSNGAPTGALPAGTTQANLTLTTDESATCRWASFAGASYASMSGTFSTTGGTSHTSVPITGLVNGGSYTRYVRCQDGLGNANTTDYPISWTVASGGDSTPPVISGGAPSGELPSGTTTTVMSVVTDETSTCRYSTTPGVSYASMSNTFSTTGGTSHSTTVAGLSDGGAYTRYVRCLDSFGNSNASDYSVAWTVAIASGGGPVPMNECSSPPPGTVFCEDFDTGSTSDAQRRAKWDDFDGALDVQFPTSDTGPSLTVGNHTAQFRAASGQSGGADLVKVLSPTHDKLYARWFQKYETGFNFNAPLHGGGLALGDRVYLGSSGVRPTGSDFAYFNIQHQNSTPFHNSLYAYDYYLGMYQDCGPPGSCFGDSLPCVYDSGASYCTNTAHVPQTTPPTVTSNVWYCVESMVDAGTTGATGSFSLWQDGVNLANISGLNIRSTTALKIENLYLALFHHDGTHSTQGVLIDNVVVSTQRIGCSSGATLDTTPPSDPGTPSCTASISPDQISCSWTASTDNVGVQDYPLERCEMHGCAASGWSQIATPTTNSYVDNVPSPTAFNYRLRARDEALNYSSYSGTGGTAVPVDKSFAYGLSMPLEYRLYSQSDRALLWGVASDIGAGWVRIDVTHSTVEPNAPVGSVHTYDWSAYDAAISELQSGGFKILIVAGYSPAWNRDGSCAFSNARPVDVQAFADFVGAAVTRYSPDAVEVWPGANSVQYYCPGVSSSHYAGVLEASYISAKTAKPSLAVLSTGMVPAVTSLPNTESPTDFLQGIYTAGAKDYFDAVGFHPYSYPDAPSVPYAGGTPNGWQTMEQTTPSLRDVMTSNGDSIKRIWPTEWGAPTAGDTTHVTEQQQGDDYTLDALKRLAQKAWSGPSFIYSPRDLGTGPTVADFFGLTDRNWNPKPGYWAYRSLANPRPSPNVFRVTQ